MRYRIQQRQVVPAPLGEVFTYFAEPSNLEAITPPSLRFEIITPPPIRMARGTLIDYALRLHGLPMRWTTLITEFEPPHRFVDVQLKGPYSYWHHLHTFSQVAGGTCIEDDVIYALPLGPLGRLLHSLLVRRDLRRIFSHRQEIIANTFGKCE